MQKTLRFLSHKRWNINLIWFLNPFHDAAWHSLSCIIQAGALQKPEMKSVVVFSPECTFLLPFLQSVLPRPWIPEIGNLIFPSSYYTESPCVGRVEESVIVGEWAPSASVGVKYELYVDISMMKSWRWRLLEACIPLKAFIGNFSKAMLEVSEHSLLVGRERLHLSHTVAATRYLKRKLWSERSASGTLSSNRSYRGAGHEQPVCSSLV